MFHHACPKCGSKDPGRKYYPVKYPIFSGLGETPLVDGVLIGRDAHGVKVALSECLVNRCRTCEYTWASDVLTPEAPA
jgi:predicted nucleic-acid-binding Zn-ribbon protein